MKILLFISYKRTWQPWVDRWFFLVLLAIKMATLDFRYEHLQFGHQNFDPMYEISSNSLSNFDLNEL